MTTQDIAAATTTFRMPTGHKIKPALATDSNRSTYHVGVDSRDGEASAWTTNGRILARIPLPIQETEDRPMVVVDRRAFDAASKGLMVGIHDDGSATVDGTTYAAPNMGRFPDVHAVMVDAKREAGNGQTVSVKFDVRELARLVGALGADAVEMTIVLDPKEPTKAAGTPIIVVPYKEGTKTKGRTGSLSEIEGEGLIMPIV